MTKTPKTLWKSMLLGLRSSSGGLGPWHIGKWCKHDGPLEMCESGFHGSVRAIDTMRYVNCSVLALVEVRGEHVAQDDEGEKQCWSEMRVIRAYEWTAKDSVNLAMFAESLVHDLWTKDYPKEAKAWAEAMARGDYAAASDASDAASTTSYAARAASNAASAASDATWAAIDAARAAIDAARAAARAASAAASDRIEAWIQERVKTLKEVEK